MAARFPDFPFSRGSGSVRAGPEPQVPQRAGRVLRQQRKRESRTPLWLLCRSRLLPAPFAPYLLMLLNGVSQNVYRHIRKRKTCLTIMLYDHPVQRRALLYFIKARFHHFSATFCSPKTRIDEMRYRYATTHQDGHGASTHLSK